MFTALALACALLSDPIAAPGGPTSIGPFAGDHSEGLEGPLTPAFCLRVFADSADMCKLSGSNVIIGLSTCGTCCVQPHTGTHLASAPADGARITFEGQATAFGCYVAPLHGQTAIVATFHDEHGDELGSLTYPVDGTCTWSWIGAAAAPGEPFQSVDLSTHPLTGPVTGGFAIDDLEANISGSSSWPPPAVYCTAKVTSGGCVPTIQTSYTGAPPELPKVGYGLGFTVQARSLEPLHNGLFFYGITGPNAAPFSCTGFLCVAPPIQRTPVMNTRGSTGCTGSLTLQWNAWMLYDFSEAYAGAPFAAGRTIWMQGWFRDPTACGGSGLSDAVSFVMQ